jgi:hypothetical protein
MRGVSKDHPVKRQTASREFSARWSALRGRFAAPQGDEGPDNLTIAEFFASPLAFLLKRYILCTTYRDTS